MQVGIAREERGAPLGVVGPRRRAPPWLRRAAKGTQPRAGIRLLGGPGPPASRCAAPKTRASVPRTITDRGLYSTKRAHTLPTIVASSKASVEKAPV